MDEASLAEGKIGGSGTNADNRRFYKITFHERHRKVVTEMYLMHVREQGNKIKMANRQRKLYTNNRKERWNGYWRNMWSHVAFEHPSMFQTLAMDPMKKMEIVDDLITFSKGKDYYA
ncbi:hypothetical protein Scep_017616 [Stephania cephalantha]|uniref:Uncharacterized protein n=1 Tax=Stephania cephalantha TaxID=152367 RepID=A0AAP0IR78_9MAGN